MEAFKTHPSVRVKGTEDNYEPVPCTIPGCPKRSPHLHCPFCVKTDSFHDPVILKAHYRVKHVDKGIDFAGLKVLRCCDQCSIQGSIKTSKEFKGAHWHCYNCKNGFNRRDEALKHYKTHFRNPMTTFQIQITHDINQMMRLPQLIEKPFEQNLEGLPDDAVLLSVSKTHPWIVSNETIVSSMPSDGQIAEESILLSAEDPTAEEISVSTTEQEGGKLMLGSTPQIQDTSIDDTHYYVVSEDGQLTATAVATTTDQPPVKTEWKTEKSLLLEKITSLEKKCEELMKEKVDMQKERDRLAEKLVSMEKLQLEVKVQEKKIESLQQREQELITTLQRTPDGAQVTHILTEMKSKQEELLNQYLSKVQRSYHGTEKGNSKLGIVQSAGVEAMNEGIDSEKSSGVIVGRDIHTQAESPHSRGETVDEGDTHSENKIVGLQGSTLPGVTNQIRVIQSKVFPVEKLKDTGQGTLRSNEGNVSGNSIVQNEDDIPGVTVKETMQFAVNGKTVTMVTKEIPQVMVNESQRDTALGANGVDLNNIPVKYIEPGTHNVVSNVVTNQPLGQFVREENPPILVQNPGDGSHYVFVVESGSGGHLAGLTLLNTSIEAADSETVHQENEVQALQDDPIIMNSGEVDITEEHHITIGSSECSTENLSVIEEQTSSQNYSTITESTDHVITDGDDIAMEISTTVQSDDLDTENSIKLNNADENIGETEESASYSNVGNLFEHQYSVPSYACDSHSRPADRQANENSEYTEHKQDLSDRSGFKRKASASPEILSHSTGRVKRLCITIKKE